MTPRDETDEMRPRLLRRLWFRLHPHRWTQAEVDAINERAEMRYVQMSEYVEPDDGEAW